MCNPVEPTEIWLEQISMTALAIDSTEARKKIPTKAAIDAAQSERIASVKAEIARVNGDVAASGP
jgi:hypothetical protein